MRSKPRTIDESTSGVSSYMDYVANAASFEAFKRKETDPLISAEALPENSSLISFKAFAQEYPEKLFPLIYKLRAEFQELFIEYYLLGKPQNFIAKAHGQIQTRIWQNLRIIEQSIGSLIILGTNPTAATLRPILEKAGLETTEFGSLTNMVCCYAKTQSYAAVAKYAYCPIPAVRKIFRPAIAALLAAKDIKAVAVGAYLRSLTHQASLTGAGLSKSYKARTRRVKDRHFASPALDKSPLVSFGHTDTLKDTPWRMFEISSEHRMARILPALHAQGKKVFGKKPAQVFAPTTPDGELLYSYIFARSNPASAVRSLLRVRGISEMSSLYNDDGTFKSAVTVPHADVQQMMEAVQVPENPKVHVRDFVKVLSGPASNYYGTVTEIRDEAIIVRVEFPTGRKFQITADITSVEPTSIAPDRRAFWGEKIGLLAVAPKQKIVTANSQQCAEKQ